jgi:hypothetical protein
MAKGQHGRAIAFDGMLGSPMRSEGTSADINDGLFPAPVGRELWEPGVRAPAGVLRASSSLSTWLGRQSVSCERRADACSASPWGTRSAAR